MTTVTDASVKKLKARKPAIVRQLLSWSARMSPKYPWRREITPYKVLISELLLRKTRASKVCDIYSDFILKYPDVATLASSSTEDLRNCLYPLGRLKRDKEILDIALSIAKDYSFRIPRDEKRLFSLIGPQSKYTVNAIRCFAFNEPVPIFDVNVNRVLSRLFSIDFGKQPHKNLKAWEFANMLLPRKNAKEFNWALLDLGRSVCLPKPNCGKCPLLNSCDYGIKVKSGSAAVERK